MPLLVLCASVMEIPGDFLFSFSWFCSVLSRDGGKNLKEKEFLPSSGSRDGPMLMPILVFTIYVFIFGCTGSCCCAWAFSSFGGSGPLFLVVQELTVVVSLAVEHRLEGVATLVVVACGLSGCVSRALEHLGLSTRGTRALAVSCGPWNTWASVLVAHGLYLSPMGPGVHGPQYSWHTGFT